MAIGITVILIVLTKKWSLGLLVGYCFMILSFTVLTRSITTDATYQLRPFWSYGIPELREQIIWNILGFIPVGMLGGMLFRWRIIPIAMVFSLCLELLQLLTHRGLFEFDDVIHNTIGTVLGIVVLFGIERIIRVPRLR